MDSRKRTARLAGLLYLVVVVTGIFGVAYVPSQTIVYGDAVATVEKTARSEGLLRLGILSSLVCETAFIFLAITLKRLLKPVGEAAASLMLTLVVVAVPIAFLNEVNRVAALLLSSRADFLAVLLPDQRSALAMLFVHLYDHGGFIAGILWGLWLLPFGYLAFRSGFIPRVFGVLLMAAGTAILLESVTFLVAPALHPVVSDVTALPSAVGEIAAMLWLLLKGARSDPASAVTPGSESETL